MLSLMYIVYYDMLYKASWNAVFEAESKSNLAKDA